MGILTPLWRVNGDAPKHCANADCSVKFDGVAFRGKSGKLYCCRTCRAERNDEFSDQDRARMVS